MTFKEKWLAAVKKKNSVLCIGIDPATHDQRETQTIPEEENKLAFCLKIIEQVAPYAAGIKPNRQYFRDFSRKDFQKMTNHIHQCGMVAIDDSKISDIGDTNDAAFYHSKIEGFDAITYTPFPGNISQAIAQAKKRNLGIIALALMSNPEYAFIKNSSVCGKKVFEWVASTVKDADGDGVVIGAPSDKNHIAVSEIMQVKDLIGDRLVLVPGIGAQGGSIDPIIKVFGDNTIANVGRAIVYSKSPHDAAKHYHAMLQDIK